VFDNTDRSARQTGGTEEARTLAAKGRDAIALIMSVGLYSFFPATSAFHGLRHTFASLLIQNGEPLAYVKDQLGHSSIKMTVDVYGHLVPGANRQEVNRLPSLRCVETQAAVAGQGS
jgi:integrase